MSEARAVGAWLRQQRLTAGMTAWMTQEELAASADDGMPDTGMAADVGVRLSRFDDAVLEIYGSAIYLLRRWSACCGRVFASACGVARGVRRVVRGDRRVRPVRNWGAGAASR